MNILTLVFSGLLLLFGLSSFAGPVSDSAAATAVVATHAGSLLTIPEPSTATLLALGISGLIFVGRRRSR